MFGTKRQNNKSLIENVIENSSREVKSLVTRTTTLRSTRGRDWDMAINLRGEHCPQRFDAMSDPQDGKKSKYNSSFETP